MRGRPEEGASGFPRPAKMAEAPPCWSPGWCPLGHRLAFFTPRRAEGAALRPAQLAFVEQYCHQEELVFLPASVAGAILALAGGEGLPLPGPAKEGSVARGWCTGGLPGRSLQLWRPGGEARGPVTRGPGRQGSRAAIGAGGCDAGSPCSGVQWRLPFPGLRVHACRGDRGFRGLPGFPGLPGLRASGSGQFAPYPFPGLGGGSVLSAVSGTRQAGQGLARVLSTA